MKRNSTEHRAPRTAHLIPPWQAILQKELRTELRQRSSLVTTLLFSIFTVVTISFATFDLEIKSQLASGLLSVAILFAAIVALPRVMLVEEEQGTGDLLRLTAKAEDVFWGKAIYNLLFMTLAALVTVFLFLGFTHVGVAKHWLLWVCVIGSCAAYAGTVTLCGALVSQASNRTALAGVISIPLLLPLTFLAVSGLRVALDVDGVFDATKGTIAGFGLLAYGMAAMAAGPYLFAAVWKR